MNLQADEQFAQRRSGFPSSVAESSVVPSFGTPPPPELTEVRVGVHSLPYLADHGFHDMVVLPGSFYIDLARRLHSEFFQQEALSLRDIVFEHPVILTDDDVAITVRIERREPDRVTYEFFDASSDAVRVSPGRQPCARMQVDVAPQTVSGAAVPPRLALEELLLPSGPSKACKFYDRSRTAAVLYEMLERNGNQYGPSFQVLANVSRLVGQASGHLANAAMPFIDGAVRLSPPLLDAAPQLLSALTIERDQTFILISIDRLVVSSLSGPAPWTARAFRTDGGQDESAEIEGAVEVLTSDDTLLWKLSGVRLAFMDRPATKEATSLEAMHLCVASTFTVEPLEDSLRFWGEQFGRPARIEFAPYNQVYQQLLDPMSAFRQNRHGINIIVLALEDWLHEERRALCYTSHCSHPSHWSHQRRLRSPAQDRASACFGARPRTTLRNGLEIAHLNQYETDYVYQEIFQDQSYLRHDIQLADGDTVIDIGANIGLFSLFVMSRCKDPAIFACEPSPRVFDLLQANCAAYGDPARVRAFNCGVAEKKGNAQFTFYEHSSVFSSFHPDESEDRAAIESVVRNVLQDALPGDAVSAGDIEDLTTHRLQSETIECPLISVSDLIRDNDITRIHLLKIDAEKSELGIIRGIAEEHWPLIDQIVMEVHDRSRAAVQSIEEELIRRGFHCSVAEEKLLEDSGLFNIYATRRAPNQSGVIDLEAGLLKKVEDFGSALDAFAESNPAPLILAIGPRPPELDDGARENLDVAERMLISRARRHPQNYTISSQTILDRYPATSFHDPHARQLGHIPYTTEGYAAIGTALFRAMHKLGRPPVKVIALDCDNTLWEGQCGEDGAEGVGLTAPYRALQEFMVRQAHSGVLIALCSKNSEADVMAVFEQRPEMPLRREHLAGWMINWAPKPDNLRALAAQLNLGLNGIVFIDDNPVECAAVQSGCPEVVVLLLPQEISRIPAFLESMWIFDRGAATPEDLDRNDWYKINSERKQQRAAAPTLRDFLDGLQLRIDINDATEQQLERVSQLTFRTNQFNLTTIRRSEAEVRAMLRSGAKCFVTSVSDRFGDYGLIGVILYREWPDRYIIDTMLLSCRALGKGVEHRMIADLACRALSEAKTIIEIPFHATDRNEPARAFVQSLGKAECVSHGDAFTLELSASDLAELRYAPDCSPEGAKQASPGQRPGLANTVPSPERATQGARGSNLSDVMQRIGDKFNTIEAIVAAIDTAREHAQPEAIHTAPDSAANASTVEQLLMDIWKKALGRKHIGLDENFFDAGGSSLKAVVVIAIIRKALKRDVSVITLFECPTIKLLASRLDADEGGGASASGDSAAAANAESRGRQRRNKLLKRRIA